VIFNADKIKAWIDKGARPSDRIYKFLANAGLLAKKEIPVQTKKNLPSEKTLQKLKDREEKLAKSAEVAKSVAESAADAPVAAAAAADPVPEAPTVATEATPTEQAPAVVVSTEPAAE
jgi:small subunit ribosomal protein S16